MVMDADFDVTLLLLVEFNIKLEWATMVFRINLESHKVHRSDEDA